MNNKATRPLNGQYVLQLDPAVFKLVGERKDASMALIQMERIRFKAVADVNKAAKKAIEKAKNDLLKAPTIKQRDDDIDNLKEQCNNSDKQAINDDNTVIIDTLKTTSSNAKTNVQKDNVKLAIQKNKDNIKKAKKDVDERYAIMIANVKTAAKQTVELILKARAHSLKMIKSLNQQMIMMMIIIIISI